ncbi:HAD family hydrolase [Actinokineospora inagensis]|uniref:HAD family hydrolase n=1 Tax=Actinokineospora inagensis TaxID=103730 RepID=UPI001FE15E65|nr:HAD-IA family hydrolase [Actinokineospora inagensis]
MTAIGAVLCDLDGVLRLWDARLLNDLDLAHGLPVGTLAAAAFAPIRLVPALTGEHTDEQWRAAVTEALTKTCGAERAKALVTDWTAATGRVDDTVAALLRRARAEVPVVLLTNATTRLESDLADLGLTDLPTAVVSSARVGFAKPDPRVYTIAADRAGVPAPRCLFVDDTAANIDPARAAGMTTLLYRHPRQLEEALAPLLT